jgi:hypothetical protein
MAAVRADWRSDRDAGDPPFVDPPYRTVSLATLAQAAL